MMVAAILLTTVQSKELKAAFDAQREFLYITTMAKNPGGMSEEFMTLAKDTEKKMTAVDDMRQQNRASSFMDHLSLVAEGSATLGWIGVSSKPADTIAEVFGGAQMFGNRILRKYKDKLVFQAQSVALLIVCKCRAATARRVGQGLLRSPARPHRVHQGTLCKRPAVESPRYNHP